MRRLSLLAPVAASFATLATSCNLLFAYAPDQICESQVRAVCHFAYACCDATERTVFANGIDQFRNEGECIQELLEEGGGNCANAFIVQEATQQARFTYDTALAEQCTKPGLDALNNCQVGALDASQLETPEACEDIDGVAFGTGLVKNGDPCFASFECADAGSVCDPPVDPDEDDDIILVTAVGTCRSPAKLDEDCTELDSDEEGSNGLCDPGTFCDGEVCVALFAVDEDCFADAQCETEFCNALDGNQCNELLDDGDDCLESNDCKSELCAPDPDDEAVFICTAQPTLQVEACNGLQGNDTVF